MEATMDIHIKNIFHTDSAVSYDLPIVSHIIPAGFPSPADDYSDQKLDLNTFLIKHPAATFFVKVEGDSMTGAGIQTGDMLIVDRALPVVDKAIVLAVINGEFTIKRIRKAGAELFLQPENENFKPIKITQDMDFEVWGIVTFVIHGIK